MLYLAIAVLLSAIIPNLFKLAQKKECRQPPVIVFNYLTCVAIVIIWFFADGSLGLISAGQSRENLQSIVIAIILGVICGVFYYLGFNFYQKSVRVSGAALSSAFGKMGIIIPILLSAAIWREYPTVTAVMGIFLALFAIIYSYFDFKTFKFTQIHTALIILFIFGGLGDFSNKLFQKYCFESHNMIFLFFIFLTALIVSMKNMKKTGRVKKSEALIGLSLGVPNMLTAVFLIKALFLLPAFVVFPMFSGATIVVAMIMSALLYKEIPSKKQLVAIGLIVVALIMVNI